MMNKLNLYKYILSAIFCILFFPFFITLETRAYTIETLENSEDYESVKALEDELIECGRDFFNSTDYPELTVDYARAVKIYVGANVFELETLTEETLANMLEVVNANTTFHPDDAAYIWQVPVKTADGKVVDCTVNRQTQIPEELQQTFLADGSYTKDELEALQAKVGQWQVPVWGERPQHYIDDLDAALGESYNPANQKMLYLLGGTPKFRQPFALYKENDTYKVAVTYLPNEDVLIDETTSDEVVTDTENGIWREYTIYDFEYIKNIVNELPDEVVGMDGGYTTDTDGGNTSSKKDTDITPSSTTGNTLLLTIAITIACVMHFICHYHNYKEKKKTRARRFRIKRI